MMKNPQEKNLGYYVVVAIRVIVIMFVISAVTTAVTRPSIGLLLGGLAPRRRGEESAGAGCGAARAQWDRSALQWILQTRRVALA